MEEVRENLNPNIDYQEIDRIVRQSNHYYLYLTNGARILAQKGFIKGLYYIIPAKTTGDIEKFEAKNCMDAIRKYIHSHNLRCKNGVIQKMVAEKEVKTGCLCEVCNDGELLLQVIDHQPNKMICMSCRAVFTITLEKTLYKAMW